MIRLTDMELSHVAEYADLFVSVFMPSRGMIHGQKKPLRSESKT